MKIGKLIRAGIRLAGLVVPQKLALKMITELLIIGGECLVRNTKTNFDDKALKALKKVVKEEKKNA